MTNNELPDNNNNRNFVSKLLQKFKQPKTQIITVLTVASVGFVGYTGVKFLVNNVIPVEVEKQLSKALKREVEVGEITSFSLNHVNINKVSINSTNQDDSYLEIDKIKVDFNLLPVFIKKELPINIKINNVTNFTELDTLIASFSHVETPEKVDSLKLPSLPSI